MIKIILFVLFILIAAESSLLFMARQQPVPANLAMLHLTDCAPPCWIGIVPGQAALDTAKARVETVYGELRRDGFTLTSGFSRYYADTYAFQLAQPKNQNEILSFAFHVPKGTTTIDDIQINIVNYDTNPLTPSLGDIQTILNTPTHFAILQNGYLASDYSTANGGAAFITGLSDRVTPQQKLWAIIMFRAGTDEAITYMNMNRIWPGYTSREQFANP